MKHILMASTILLTLLGNAEAREMNVALSSEIRSNIPGGTRDEQTDAVLQNVIEGLVAYADDGSIKPVLAESFSISPDQLTYTFKLRNDVLFHNGTHLTSADFIWNWERYMAKDTGWECRADFDGSRNVNVTSVKAPDDHTVEIKLAAPSAVLLQLMARPQCNFTGIVSKDSFAADGHFIAPIGTGPFKWAEWKRGEYVRLTKFDGYVSPANDGKADGDAGSKRPLMDGIKFVFIPDPATTKFSLNTGVLDMAVITADAIPEFKDSKTVNVIFDRNNEKHLFYFQTRDSVLKSVVIRRAMAESLDLDQLVAAVSNGIGKANSSMISAGSSFFSAEQAKRIPFNLEKAKKDLAEAGYKGEPITIIANERGRVPSLAAAVVAQSMWQQAGLNIKVEVLDFATQTNRRRSGKYQIISQTVSAQLDPALAYNFYVGDKDANPSFMWDDPKAIELMKAAYNETDHAKRQAIFDSFHALMLEQVPGIFLYDAIDVWAVSKKVHGSPVWQANPRLWEVKLDD